MTQSEAEPLGSPDTDEFLASRGLLWACAALAGVSLAVAVAVAFEDYRIAHGFDGLGYLIAVAFAVPALTGVLLAGSAYALRRRMSGLALGLGALGLFVTTTTAVVAAGSTLMAIL